MTADSGKLPAGQILDANSTTHYLPWGEFCFSQVYCRPGCSEKFILKTISSADPCRSVDIHTKRQAN